jgi:spermidine synthase
LNDRINASKGYVNRDLKPVCYYFTSILWGGILSERVRDTFLYLFSMPPIVFFLPLIVVFFFFRRRAIVYFSVFAVGASEISAEVILIVLFQVFYGYIYGWVGAIIACYMLGLAIGALLYIRSRFLKKAPVDNLLRIEIALSIYFLIMIGVALVQPSFVNMIIVFLVFVGGLLGGMHFQLSVAVLEKQKAGFIYGVDLIGSSVGALVTAMILIPILGIIQTLFLFGAMNLLLGIGLATVRPR